MRLITAFSMTALAAFVSLGSAQDQGRTGPDVKEWNAVVDKAVAYLKSSQEDNGGWSTEKSPGVTGIVLTGLLRTGRVTPQDPLAERGLKYIESLVNPEEKHIAGKNPKVQLKNYVTCINVMALAQADRAGKYKGLIGDAVTFLKQLQWDEGEGKTPKDDFYGGAGYDSKSRPDLSNTQMFLDALKAAGVGADDPALKKAMVFVSRCQNLKSEYNDQPWAKLIDDGSFIYTAASGGITKVVDAPLANGALPGYGSMTYAGVKSLIYCGVTKNDPRVKKAYEWLKTNYSLEQNAGMPEIRSDWGLYYYYHTMAKTLDVLDMDYFVDAKGVKHDWRKELADTLAKKQRTNGSWVNIDRWFESDPNLVTGYALMALSYCRPKE